MSSGAEKLSISNWFVIVLNTFGRPVRFQFFWFLTTLQLKDRQGQLCRRCLFNIAQACTGKWTRTDTFEESQYDLVEGVCSILPEPAQENGL